MATDISGVGFQPTVQLNQDFGHSPVGSLGGRSVQQVPSGAPRAQVPPPQTGFIATLKSLGERFLNAITPHGVRAEPKYRLGLENTSKQVGELLGALSKTGDHKVDGAGAQKAIDGLRGAMQPMLSRGADYDEVFSARVDLNVKNMSKDQLLALRDGVALTKDSALKNDPHVAVIQQAVAKEIESRIADRAGPDIGAKFRTALAQGEKHGPEGTKNGFDEMLVKAGEVLRNHGVPNPNREMQLGLVMDTLDRMMSAGDIDPGDVRKLIGELPSKDQLAIVQREPTGRDVPTLVDDVTSIAVGCVLERRDTSHAGFEAGFAKVMAHDGPVVDDPKGPLHDPIGFSREVEQLAQNYDTHVEHCRVHGLPVDEAFKAKAEQAKAKLESLLLPENLSLQELNDSQLQKLNSSLAKLGVAHGREEIAAEMRKRRDDIQQAYNAKFHGVATAIRSGDLVGVLRALDEASGAMDEAAVRHQKLEGKHFKAGDNDKLVKFRQGMMEGALKAMSVDDLRALAVALKTTEMQKMQACLGEVGLPLFAEHHDLSHSMLNRVYDLEMLDNAIEDVIRAKGGEPPPEVENDFRLANISPQVRGALREVFGVEVGPTSLVQVKIGVGSQRVQDTVDDELRSEVGRPDKEFMVDAEAELGSGIAEGMWKDMGRANYSWRGEDGVSRPLLETPGWNNLPPHEQTARRQGAVDKLREISGGNEKVMMAVSKIANQNGLAGIQKLLLSEHSPLRLPDGTPGRLVGPERVSYNLSPDGEGGVKVRFDYAIEDGTHFMKMPGGEMVPLLPGTSKAHFTFEATIDSGGNVTMSDPVQLMYDVQPDPWKKDYPQPHKMDDVIGTPHAGLRSDFRDFVTKRHVQENLNFLEALDTFDKNPTLAGAREIAARFIGADSAEYVNIDDATSRSILEALSGPGAGALGPQQLRDLFGKAQGEVDGMMVNGPLKEFIQQNGGKVV